MEHTICPAFVVTLGTSRSAPPEALLARLNQKSLKTPRSVEVQQMCSAEYQRVMRLGARGLRAGSKRARPEQDVNQKKQKLQNRMSMAERLRSAQLEKRKLAALRFLSRRAAGLARAAVRREVLREELELQQLTVESRRHFLQGLALAKLRQEHDWVESRRVMRRVDDLSLEGRRSVLEGRLLLADRARGLLLDLRAARAGLHVARARTCGQAAQARALERAAAAKAKLEERMRGAEERRQAALRAVKAHCSVTPPRSP